MGHELRQRLGQYAAKGLYYSGLLRSGHFLRSQTQREHEVCVLGLHRVLSDKDFSRTNSLHSIVLRERTFSRLLEHLRETFSVVSLQAFLSGETSDAKDHRFRCLVTFDDGWQDNYKTAFPLLKKYGIPGTIFLVTGMIGTGQIFWVEQLVKAWRDPSLQEQIRSRLGRSAPRSDNEDALLEVIEYLKHMPAEKRIGLIGQCLPPADAMHDPDNVDRMMTWEQVQEMCREGVDFGAHTWSHPLLSFESDATVSRELQDCKETLEAKLGRPVHSLAYPNGDWDARVRTLATQAGYQCAFTTQPGWHHLGQDSYSVRRVLIHEGNVTGLDSNFCPAKFSLTLARGG